MTRGELLTIFFVVALYLTLLAHHVKTRHPPREEGARRCTCVCDDIGATK